MKSDEFKKKLIDRSFSLARRTLVLVDEFPNKRSAWIISDQLFRAITSIGANITEAQAASSRKDFTNFLNHALKSGNESKFWLNLSKYLKLTPKQIDEIGIILIEVDELTRILGSSIATLKSKNF